MNLNLHNKYILFLKKRALYG